MLAVASSLKRSSGKEVRPRGQPLIAAHNWSDEVMRLYSFERHKARNGSGDFATICLDAIDARLFPIACILVYDPDLVRVDIKWRVRIDINASERRSFGHGTW